MKQLDYSLSIDTTNLQKFTPTLPTNPEEVCTLVSNYFSNCVEKKKHPTFSGLSSSLGLSREELIHLSTENPTIQKIIQKAKQLIVDNVEQLIFQGVPPGGLTFWLKNNDQWVDKFEYEHSEKKISDLLRELEQEGKLIQGDVVTN